MENKLVEEFINRPYMLNMGKGSLSKYLKVTPEDIIIAKKIARKILDDKQNSNIINNFVDKPIIDNKIIKNVLVIGDTHIPYEKEGYLEFCKQQYDKYNCDTVIHIGDLIDSHATSRHPSIPDAYSPGDELYYTKKKLKAWYKTFPHMKVCIGNHDIRIYKIASEIGIASKWLRGFANVLNVPNWTFEDSFEINNIIYTHGTGSSGRTAAITRALNLGQSVVMGHLHSDAGILYHTIKDRTIFGMIVGAGVDQNSYGMNYSKNDPKKSTLACAVILDTQPILIPMNQ